MALGYLRFWRNVATSLIAMVALVAFVRLGYSIADGLQDPFIVTRAEVITPAVPLGRPISVRYDAERRRFCITSIAQFWVDRDTGQALYRQRVPGGYTPLGKRTTLVTLQAPGPLPVGRYTYRAIMESDCGVTSYTYPVPDADFEVVP